MSYSGVFLFKESQQSLLKWCEGIFGPPYSTVKAHHMTIKFMPHDDDVASLPSGSIVPLKVIGYSSDRYCQAVVVESRRVPSANPIPHITISLNNSAPVYSNELLSRGWVPVDDGPVLIGKTGRYSHDTYGPVPSADFIANLVHIENSLDIIAQPCNRTKPIESNEYQWKLERLLQRRPPSDITICVGEYTLHLHKYVLRCQSTYFCDLISSLTDSGMALVVPLDDISADCAIDVFWFMYSPKKLTLTTYEYWMHERGTLAGRWGCRHILKYLVTLSVKELERLPTATFDLISKHWFPFLTEAQKQYLTLTYEWRLFLYCAKDLPTERNLQSIIFRVIARIITERSKAWKYSHIVREYKEVNLAANRALLDRYPLISAAPMPMTITSLNMLSITDDRNVFSAENQPAASPVASTTEDLSRGQIDEDFCQQWASKLREAKQNLINNVPHGTISHPEDCSYNTTYHFEYIMTRIFEKSLQTVHQDCLPELKALLEMENMLLLRYLVKKSFGSNKAAPLFACLPLLGVELSVAAYQELFIPGEVLHQIPDAMQRLSSNQRVAPDSDDDDDCYDDEDN